MASPPKMQAKKKIQAQKDESKRKVKKELFSDDKHLPCPAGGRTAEGIYFPNQANHPSPDLIRFGKTSIQQKNRRSTNEGTTATLPIFVQNKFRLLAQRWNLSIPSVPAAV